MFSIPSNPWFLNKNPGAVCAVPGALPWPEHLQDANRWPGERNDQPWGQPWVNHGKAIDHLRVSKTKKTLISKDIADL